MFLINPYVHDSGVPSFSPADITSLTAWWDPDDSATVTITAGHVAQLDDKESVIDLVEYSPSTSNEGPVITTSGGRDWLEFVDGDTSCLIYHANPASAAINFGSGEFTIVMVVKTTVATVGPTRLLQKGNNTAGRYAMDINRPNVGVVRGVAYDGTSTVIPVTGNGYNDGVPHIIAYVRNNADDDLIVYIDGVERARTAQGSLGDLDSGSDTGIWDDLLIGAGPASDTLLTSRYEGFMGEFMFCNDVLSSGDFDDLHTYLAAKWGATLA